MNHLSWKSLTFYGVALGSVVLLFKGVSRYGESHLKAPIPISGSYLIPVKTLTGCQTSENLMLKILQSGIYLNGALSVAEPSGVLEKNTQEKPLLTGTFHQQHLQLSGNVPFAQLCHASAGSTNASHSLFVEIQANVTNETLQGQIFLKPQSNPLEFVAKKEVSNENQPMIH
jgi:hypothetical protein